MAVKKYLTLAGLTTYDTEIKEVISAGDAAALASAKSYADEKLTGLTGGTIVVKEAEHATKADSATTADSATSATKATQDGNGKVISSTYETKTDATAKLTEAKGYTDTVAAGKADSDHNHDTKYDAKGAAATAESNAKAYADSAATTVKNDLLNGAGAAYDTLKELGALIDTNKDAIDALEDVAAGKADADHGHEIADVTGLQTALDGKAASSHGTHVTFDSTNKPKMDGTAAFGTSTKVARADHVHPTDTSRAAQTDLDALETVVAGKAASGHGHDVATTSAAGFMSADMVTKLNGIATGANKTTVDTAMSSTSTNPVQNKIVYAELAKKATTSALDGVSSVANEAKNAAATNTQAISANTSSISGHTTRISNLETKVGDGFEEITTAEIQALFA